MTYYLYVDESCHLESDNSSVMCIGYVKVPEANYNDLKNSFWNIKAVHRNHSEIKWNKFSKSRLPMYKHIVDFFFDSKIEFKCILVKYKGRLGESDLSRGSHENFYYKMIEYLLNKDAKNNNYRVFLDMINSRGKDRLNKIQESLADDPHHEGIFRTFQHLHSHHNIFFELTDLLVGAVAYSARKLTGEVPLNIAKDEFLDYLENKSGYSLAEATELWESKFVIIDHQPKHKTS